MNCASMYCKRTMEGMGLQPEMNRVATILVPDAKAMLAIRMDDITAHRLPDGTPSPVPTEAGLYQCPACKVLAVGP